MEIGITAIISTLWPVYDLTTALLMQKFYEQHLAGTPPAAALHMAQRWLRDLEALTASNIVKKYTTEAQNPEKRLYYANCASSLV